MMNFSKLVILCTFSIAINAFALSDHSDHDWRADKEAFKSAKIDSRNYLNQPLLERNSAPVTILESEFRTKLEELTGIKEVTIDGIKIHIPERGSNPGKDLARAWLKQEFEALGFTIKTQTYFDLTGARGINFIAEKPGTSGKVLLLSSHMDSVNNAGANDDGTGTVAALLIAQALKDVNNFHTLRIVAFDGEEIGLVGSNNYTKSLKPGEIIGDIQLEMMAFNSKKDGKFHLIDCNRSDSTFMTIAIMQEIQTMKLPLTRVEACTNQSDHGSFWKRKIPAVVLSENFFGGDGDTCYHEACDVLDNRLNLNYASLITTAVANAASKLIQQ
jgi:hypothetical protein